jgi:hypothetical protein
MSDEIKVPTRRRAPKCRRRQHIFVALRGLKIREPPRKTAAMYAWTKVDRRAVLAPQGYLKKHVRGFAIIERSRFIDSRSCFQKSVL